MTDDDPRVRLELLIGHLADQLAPARELMDLLRLRANASTVTRNDLDLLRSLAGSIWERLELIREEAASYARQSQLRN